MTTGLTWRPMVPSDLPAILSVAAAVHPTYPEGEAVFMERMSLAPHGCLCLSDGQGLAGYLLSHPWRERDPPALDTLLGQIPPDAPVWYVHDLALLPRARGGGAAGRAVEHLVAAASARGCAALALVAVNDSVGFWERQGFRVVHDPSLASKLASYDDAARYMIRPLR